ncbi:MAG: exopolysaccharide Pel transporter PelG [Tumebacillaceae bacterium]
MAGIGVSLKKALGESRRSSKWRVYGAAAFVAAGPWLLTLTSLFLMLWWGRTFGLVAQGRELFLATVTYAMIGSNLISTTAQFFLTRYLADALYVKAYDRLLSAFVGVFTTTGIVALVLAAVGQSFLPLPFAYKVWSVVLTVLLTQLGLLMILLSAAKAYREIAFGFLAGLGFLLVALLVVTLWRGAPNLSLLLALFTCSQGVAFLFLGAVAIRDIPGQIPALYQWGAHYRRYPELIWIGLGYALALWIDNLVYWVGNGHVVIAGSYVLTPAYDLAKFWTFLALVPGFTLFTVNVETAFYQVFRRFYNAIESGETLAPIRIFEEELRTETKAALMGMAKMQLFIATLSWVVVQQFFGRFTEEVVILQWTIIGSVPFMVWITAFLLLLYFDARKQAMRAVLLGCVALAACTKVAILLEWPAGTGFLIGSVLMLCITLAFLNQQLDRLLYYAFYDPNGIKPDMTPPAIRPTWRQQRAGYPVLGEVPLEIQEKEY